MELEPTFRGMETPDVPDPTETPFTVMSEAAIPVVGTTLTDRVELGTFAE